MRVSLPDLQKAMDRDKLDGWLLYDFHGSNDIARALVNIQGFVTRRWFCWIPRSGPMQIVRHVMEAEPFEHLDAVAHPYLSWQQLDSTLRETLGGARRIAMEFSPDNAVPPTALVDAGTIDKIRAWGLEVVSSADLVAEFLAVLTDRQIATHRRAAAALIQIQNQAFGRIAESIRSNQIIHEHDIVAFIRDQFDRHGLVTGDGPICAVGAHAGSPHYEPPSANSAPIGRDQLVLIDLWAKEDSPDSVYADITWTAYTGPSVPVVIQTVFDTVRTARDRAVTYLNECLSAGKPARGCDTDDAVRAVITEAGYGEYFIHRTGHSIGTEVHSIGPNIDNLETQDHRRLRNGMCFSIEPGIYLPDFGIRSEIDVLIENGRAEVTTLPLQMELTGILP